VDGLTPYLVVEDSAGVVAARRFLILSVISLLIGFAGSWVNFKLTHIIVGTVLLYGVLLRSMNAKKLIVVFILVGPILSSRFPLKLGPLPDVTFDRLLAGLALVVEMGDRRAHGIKWITSKLDRRMLFLILAAAVSIVFCFMLKVPIRVLIDSLIIPYIMYLMVKRYADDPWFLKTLYHVFIINILISGLLGMAERVTHKDLLIIGTGDPKFEAGRINGPSADAEAYGLMMTMLILLVTNVGGAISDTVGWKRMRVAAIGLGSLAVLFTLTRGIWIALVIGLLSQLALNIRKSAPVVVAIVLLFPFAVPAAGLLFGSGAFSSRLENSETIYARLATYESALKMFVDSPVVGKGYGSFTEAYERDIDRYESYYNNVVSVHEPHNAYLVTLAETGIVGITFFLLMFGSMFWYAALAKRYDTDPVHVAFVNAAICIAIAYLVDGFGHDFTRSAGYINKLLYVSMGIVSGLVQTAQDRAHPKVSEASAR
jgi:hypothetical protein